MGRSRNIALTVIILIMMNIIYIFFVAENSNPAANAYTVKTGQTSRGVCTGPKATLKGRGTSFVYAGYALQSSVRLFDA